MLSRVAEYILWMSRYVERAENTARIIDVNFRQMLDTGAAGDHSAAWEPLVSLVPQTLTLFDSLYPAVTADAVLRFMTFDLQNPNSIRSAIGFARENARSIRDGISSEMWEQINTLYLKVTGAGAEATWAANPHSFYRQVQYGSQQFQGTTDATMTHDDGWHFIQLGKSLERADSATRILDTKYRLLVESPSVDEAEAVEWMAVLKSCSAYEAYRRRQHLARIEHRGVARFLLLDPLFPRSVLFCVNEAWRALKTIGGSDTAYYNNGAERSLGLLRAQLEFADIDDVLPDLHGYLDGIQRQLNRVGDELRRVYLSAQLSPTFSSASTRAAQAMAEQQ
jgi:uncharacterized alpha-E superfamily protein